MKQAVQTVPSSGNVYEDLGFKDAEAMLAKARIVAEIVRTMSRPKTRGPAKLRPSQQRKGSATRAVTPAQLQTQTLVYDRSSPAFRPSGFAQGVSS